MYQKIIEDLGSIDPTDIVKAKKVLGKLQTHILYAIKKKNLVVLTYTYKAIETFLSANKSRFHIEMQENLGSRYRIKRFLNELERFIALCNMGLENGC